MNAFLNCCFGLTDEAVSLVANKCLAEIGPVNLSTLVLSPAKVEFFNCSDKRQEIGNAAVTCNQVVKSLINLTINKDQETSVAAAQALKHVLATKQGRDLVLLNEHKSASETGNRDSFEIKGEIGKAFFSLLAPFVNALSTTTIDADAISSRGTTEVQQHIEYEKFKMVIDCENLWCTFPISKIVEQKNDTNRKHAYNHWICNIVTSLLNCMTKQRLSLLEKSPVFGRYLITICRLQPNFCEEIFPSLIFSNLQQHYHDSNGGIREILSRHICTFLKKHFDQYCKDDSLQRKDTRKPRPFQHIRCVELVLNVEEYLRRRNIPTQEPQVDGTSSRRPRGVYSSAATTVWQNNFWLQDINYLHVARAALDCGSYFTACLYCEIWCQILMEETKLQQLFSTSILNSSALDVLYESALRSSPCDTKFLEDVKHCQAILFESCSMIGDVEAIHGCGSDRLFNEKSRVENVVQEAKYLKAFGMYDMLLQSNKEGQNELMKCLLNSGCYHTLNNYTKGTIR